MATAAEESKAGAPGGEIVEPKVEAAPPAKPETPKATPAATKLAVDTGSPGTSAVARTRVSGDEEIPEDAELLELSKSALEKRLARHSRTELKAHFGTDNPNEIKKKLERLAKYEADEEERKRAEMTEREKMQADLASEQRLRQDAERRALRVHTERVVEREEVKITRIAGEYFDADIVEDMMPRLARYLSKEFSESELEALGKNQSKYEKTISKWCKDQVEKKPKYGKDYVPAVKEPLDSGIDDNNARHNAGNNADMRDGRTFAPGRANSMSPAEAKAAARKMGYSW